MKAMVCTQCGAKIKHTTSKGLIVCKYCGTEFFLHDEECGSYTEETHSLSPKRAQTLPRRPLIYRLTADAMLAAVYVLLAHFVALNLGFITLSWSTLPLLLAAMLFPITDVLCIAFVGSAVEQLLYGLDATTPIWLLIPILFAAVAGLGGMLVRRKKNAVLLVVTLVVCEFVYTLINSAGIVLGDAIYLGSFSEAFTATLARMPARLLNCAARAALSAIAIPLLLPPLRRVLHIR